MWKETRSLTSENNYLVTVSEVGSYLKNATLSTSSISGTIQNFISYVSDMFESYCNTGLKQTEWTGYYDSCGDSVLYTANSPIQSISALQYRVTPVSDYQDLITSPNTIERNVIIYDNYIELYGYNFPAGRQSIKLVYNAGYDVVPGDVKKCAIEAVMEMYNESRLDGSQDRLGITNKNLNDAAGSQNTTFYQLSDRHKTILDIYRKRFI